MEDLIKALQILLKYGNPKYPTHCEHDILYILGINPEDVSDQDKAILIELGIENGFVDEINENIFYSFKFGSA